MPPTTRDSENESCPFCRIAQGLDPDAKIVCEGTDWIALFPPEPATPGHTLVIPREHVPDVFSLDHELGAAMMDAIVKVGRIVENSVTPSGINLISSAGEAAEQTVFHLHFHLVPRYKGDEMGLIWPPKSPPDQGLIDSLLQRMQSSCEAG